MANFIQSAPVLSNQFTADKWLQAFLQWRLQPDYWQKIRPSLEAFGARVANDINELGWQAERHNPVHRPYDTWGNRIDLIEVHEAWQKLTDISATEGIVATAYEREFGDQSRLVQAAKLYLFHPSSAFNTCPMAMTDGCARVIETFGDAHLKTSVFKHLISRDPKQFWTSGQWMTERSGGSDVSGTETVAKRDGSRFRLYGTKWFTSAVTAQVALALGRIEGAVEGSRGLSLFCVELRQPDGSFNHIRVHRLKDKLGTKALPTAELELEGSIATLVGAESKGVKTVATMLNITRFYNAICSVATAQRALFLVKDYSRRRKVFGQPMADQALHRETLADNSSEFVGALQLSFEVARLLGKEECGTATPEELLVLRLLTPITKSFTGKMAISVTSEMLECFGGVGYCEDSRIPVLFRDAQVFPIWEGATNVLSLDVLRVLEKTEAISAFAKIISTRIQTATPTHRNRAEKLGSELKRLLEWLDRNKSASPETWMAMARDLSFSIARVYIASLHLEMAAWNDVQGYGSPIAKILDGELRHGLVKIREANEVHRQNSAEIGLWS